MQATAAAAVLFPSSTVVMRILAARCAARAAATDSHAFLLQSGGAAGRPEPCGGRSSSVCPQTAATRRACAAACKQQGGLQSRIAAMSEQQLRQKLVGLMARVGPMQAELKASGAGGSDSSSRSRAAGWCCASWLWLLMQPTRCHARRVRRRAGRSTQRCMPRRWRCAGSWQQRSSCWRRRTARHSTAPCTVRCRCADGSSGGKALAAAADATAVAARL